MKRPPIPRGGTGRKIRSLEMKIVSARIKTTLHKPAASDQGALHRAERPAVPQQIHPAEELVDAFIHGHRGLVSKRAELGI